MPSDPQTTLVHEAKAEEIRGIQPDKGQNPSRKLATIDLPEGWRQTLFVQLVATIGWALGGKVVRHD